MGLLDNVDEQLNKMRIIDESLKAFKKLKVKNINLSNQINKRAKKQKHIKLGHNYYKKIKKVKNISNRKERNRCPREYKLYIISKWWDIRKNEYYQKYPRICSACGSTAFIVLHHLFYGNYSREKDEDLTPLCSSCHHEFHRTYLLKRNLRKSTKYFIKNKKHL